MTFNRRHIAIGAIVIALILIVIAWFFRYSVKPLPGIAGGAYIKLDRWTGAAYVCRGQICQGR
jgi:hypothetical protein